MLNVIEGLEADYVANQVKGRKSYYLRGLSGALARGFRYFL